MLPSAYLIRLRSLNRRSASKSQNFLRIINTNLKATLVMRVALFCLYPNLISWFDCEFYLYFIEAIAFHPCSALLNREGDHAFGVVVGSSLSIIIRLKKPILILFCCCVILSLRHNLKLGQTIGEVVLFR